MHDPLNGVGTPPAILILAIPSCQIHPSIIPHQLVAVCCVICRLFHEVPSISCHTLSFVQYITTDFTVRPLLRLYACSRRFLTISDAYEAQQSL
jgi:hypothetical protein